MDKLKAGKSISNLPCEFWQDERPCPAGHCVRPNKPALAPSAFFTWPSLGLDLSKQGGSEWFWKIQSHWTKGTCYKLLCSESLGKGWGGDVSSHVWRTALTYALSLLKHSPAGVWEDVTEVPNHKEVFTRCIRKGTCCALKL